jgi:hypothetical protein
MESHLSWLLEGPQFVVYRTLIDLQHLPKDSPQVETARRAMIADTQVQALIHELQGLPGIVIKNHKSANHPLHKLVFLADLGMRASDPAMDTVISRVFEHISVEGPFQTLINVPVVFGGNGKDQWSWMLCDAPNLLYALCKLGLAQNEKVRIGVQHLMGLVCDNGFPCAVSPEVGKFRGPGRKEDPCPYANLIMLKLLAQTEWRDSPAAHSAAESLLHLWACRIREHPYLFRMGTDFSKLKAPLIWYDILHVFSVLSLFPWLHGEPRLGKMANVVRAKADELGRFTPESVWASWKNWEFAQKKVPSHWLTLLAETALQKIDSKS